MERQNGLSNDCNDEWWSPSSCFGANEKIWRDTFFLACLFFFECWAQFYCWSNSKFKRHGWPPRTLSTQIRNLVKAILPSHPPAKFVCPTIAKRVAQAIPSLSGHFYLVIPIESHSSHTWLEMRVKRPIMTFWYLSNAHLRVCLHEKHVGHGCADEASCQRT